MPDGQWTYNSNVAVVFSPGILNVFVRDTITGCRDSMSVPVMMQQSTMQVMVNNDTISCGSPTALLTATVFGGMPPYSFIWDQNITTQSAAYTQPGSYMVSVTDQSGCPAIGMGYVFNGGGANFQIFGTTQSTACTAPTGSINVTSNGTGITYQWNTGATGPSIMNLGTGQYCVVATDINGCIRDTCFYIDNNSSLAINNATASNPTCTGNNGYISVGATGGTPPYTYLWSNNMTGSSIQGLAAGTYSATVTDALGCTSSYYAVLQQQSGFFATTSSTNPTCGAPNGMITVFATGGTSPYLYTIAGTSATTNNVFTGLPAGVYTILISDAGGCTQTITDSLVNVNNISVATTAVGGSCANALGTATVQTNGANVTYLWSNSATTQTIQAASGTYTVTVTQSGSNCVATSSVTIPATTTNIEKGLMIPDNVAQSLVSSIQVTGHNGGVIDAANPLTAVWANLEHSYRGDLSIDITCPSGITSSIKAYPGGGGGTFLGRPNDGSDPTIKGTGFPFIFSASGAMTLDATTGVADPLNPTTPNASSILGGNFLPVAPLSAFNTCPIDGIWTITLVDHLGVDNGFLFDWGIQLPGSCTNTHNFGTVLTNADPSATLAWSDGQTTTTIQDATNSTYSVTVTGLGNCTGAATMEVPTANYSFNVVAASCLPNATDGSVTLATAMGSMPTALWSNGQTGMQATGLAAGWYSVTITNGNCTAHRDVYVPASTVCIATIEGFVLNETNGNCTHDASDVAVPNKMIRCTNVATGAVHYDYTDMQGFFHFTVDTGRYIINFYSNYCDGYSVVCPATGNINVHAAAPNTVYGG
ncbi:MAG: hypothetical protein RI894_2102, partial [Bacteroidota bacterium]